jgi:uncharacterized protein (DUF2062 family)
MRWLRRSFAALLHLDDTPHRTALAFAIGVWIAFFPIWGIHSAMAIGIAFALRLSRAAMLLGAWVNNPWTAPPFYTAGTMLGCWLLRVPAAGLEDIDWSLKGWAFLEAMGATLRPYLWPFVVGNTLVGVVLGGVGYVVVRRVLERRRKPQPPAPV